ncbi:MAG TPA: transglycosylase domain-containing protein [Anaeromyxobacter sp.]
MLSSRRRLVTALAVVAFLYGAAQLVASTDAVERRLRARIDAALRARLGDELSLGAYVGVDLLFRVTFGPIDVPVQRGGPPVVSVARATARASLPALLRGRIEPASILLGDVRVAPGPDGRDLRAIAARVEAMRAARAFGADGAQGGARDLPKLKLRGLLVELPLHGATIALGPVDANVIVHRGAEGPRLDADVILRSGGRAALMAERGSSGWRARLRVAGLGPGALPPGMRGGAARLAEGSLSVDAEAEAPADLSRAVAQVRAEIEGLVLAGERIGPQPVGPLSASAAGTLEWDRAARRVTLRDGAATLLKSLAASVSGELALGPPATFSVALRADRLDYSALLAALPPALAVPPGAPRPSGTLDGRLEVGGPLLAPAEWTLSAALELGRIRDAARHGGRTSLAEPFLHRPPLDAGGRGRELVVGPANPNFVPIGELPEHVIRAVTTAEDGGFFGHAGFDFDELRNAFAQGAEKGRVVRGGSTISQQLAKNLFLGPERTFARKVREAVVTVGLEASLPKRRLMEIYLNVAEWGPGLWGIGPAARHWFGKDARALTPKEAAFLASVIPNPVRYHAMFERGATTEGWDERVRGLLFKMAQQGSLSDAELAGALVEPVVFASAPLGTP